MNPGRPGKLMLHKPSTLQLLSEWQRTWERSSPFLRLWIKIRTSTLPKTASTCCFIYFLLFLIWIMGSLILENQRVLREIKRSLIVISNSETGLPSFLVRSLCPLFIIPLKWDIGAFSSIYANGILFPTGWAWWGISTPTLETVSFSPTSGQYRYRFWKRYQYFPLVGNIDTLLRNGTLFPHSSECPPILGNDPILVNNPCHWTQQRTNIKFWLEKGFFKNEILYFFPFFFKKSIRLPSAWWNAKDLFCFISKLNTSWAVEPLIGRLILHPIFCIQEWHQRDYR